MSDKPVFIYAATYTDFDMAWADFESMFMVHGHHLVGTYDVAVINKDADGKVHVHKHEKPTQHGVWGGIAVGALVGVLFPPSLIGAAAVGGAIGGIGGHLRRGISRGDAKELGELLDGDRAAIILIAESNVGEQVDKVLARAEKSVAKEVQGDREDFKRALEEAEEELEHAAEM